jgi:hypothetical protein
MFMAKVPIKKANKDSKSTLRFEAVSFDRTFEVLDGIAFLEAPDIKAVAQFAGIDPRTAGKILKNAKTIGIVSEIDGLYVLSLPYPYKGSKEQKEIALSESLIRLPLLINTRQFLTLGDNLDNALRKAATVVGVTNYDPSDFAPLIKWAKELRALNPKILIEDLVDEATELKQERQNKSDKKIVFISHSTKDKPIIRKLATDLKSEGIDVWLDEQRILVGESISEKIGQGLAESDYFIIAMSEHSIRSEWVKKELNAAIVNEIERRKTIILPVKLGDVEMPQLIKEKKYADFTVSYKQGLQDLIKMIKNG